MIQSTLLSSIPSVKHAFTVKDTLSDEVQNLLAIPRQTHSDTVTVISHEGDTIVSDGLITLTRNMPVGIKTADCVPILLVDPKKGMVSAVHAGWKGTFKRIVQNAVHRLVDLGSNTPDIFVGIGPAIKSCCYDIPQDRTQLFREEFGTESIINTNNISFIDLQHINFLQLVESGISSDHIDIIPECTHCNTEYYSYRRGDRDKRMTSYIQRVQ